MSDAGKQASLDKFLDALAYSTPVSTGITAEGRTVTTELVVPPHHADFEHVSNGTYTCEPGDTCPHCHYGIIEECLSFSEKTCEFFVYCQNCNAYICRYKPMPHQALFHNDDHQKKLYAGGFGSAKTYTCGMEFLASVLQIPNSAGMVGAKTWGQVGDTCLKFICDNLPKALVAGSNRDKVNWHIDLINGSRISAKAFDQEGKIRSANLSAVWVEEASEVEYDVIAFLAARLRNKAAFFKGKNRLKMLLSSNPDVGWLNSNWLMISDKIYYHGDVPDRYTVPVAKREPSTSTHISATSCNTYLPPNYERDLAANKEQWWINRYLKGSFNYTEGLVYPEFHTWFVDPFNIPKHWTRICGMDFGRRDPTAYILGAIDPLTSTVYFYDEVYETIDDQDLSVIVNKIKHAESGFPEYMWAYPRQADPRGRNRDQVSGKTWYDAYQAAGLNFVPAENMETNSVAPTITKLAGYAKHGHLKFFKTLTHLYDEFRAYKYPARTLGESKNQGEAPIDAHNHLPDAVRYAMAPLPPFPAVPQDFDEIFRDYKDRLHRSSALAINYGTKESAVSDFTDNFL